MLPVTRWLFVAVFGFLFGVVTGLNPANAGNVEFKETGGAGGGSTVIVQDEGVTVGTATTLDFKGAGVTASFGAGTASITIPGGAGVSGGGAAGQVAYWSTPTNVVGNAGLTFSAPGAGADVLTVAGGTLASTKRALAITATTQDVALSAVVAGSGAGAASGTAYFGYTPGYSNALGTTWASYSTNSSTSTGLNTGAFDECTGVNAGALGVNVGSYDTAANGPTSVGTWGLAVTAKNAARNIGVYGQALNTGTGLSNVGGLFYLGSSTTAPTPSASAALVADNGTVAADIFAARDNGTAVFTVGDNTSDIVTITGGTLTAAKRVFKASATLPASDANAFVSSVTGNGGVTAQGNAYFELLAGTAAGTTYALQGANYSTNTGLHVGTYALSDGVQAGVGYNAGVYSSASGADMNVGVHGRAIGAKNNARNIAVYGQALNTGTGLSNIGGYFYLGNPLSGPPAAVSAAVVADNGAVAAPVLIARDNGTAVFTVADNGFTSVSIDGAVATPALTFGATADPDTGFWHPAANELAASVSGAEAFRVTSTGFRVSSDGTAALPSLTIGATADPDTGFGHPGANILAVSVGGSEVFRWATTLISAALGLMAPTYATSTNCNDSAGAAACANAAAGTVVIDAGATTVVVSTTAVTANSRIMVMFDKSAQATCNATVAVPSISARTAGTSFTIEIPAAPVTDPACFTYFLMN